MHADIKKLAGPLLPALRWIRYRRARREHRQLLESIAPWVGGFANKTVLDVGSDLSGLLVRILARRFSPREVVGLNLDAADRRISARARLEKGDIRGTRYPDATFDVIFSTSAFEHITGLDQAIGEMHRILKPGGYLFSHFGPIWSASYGHHLWVRHGLRLYNYWNLILPPYCHLLQTRQQIEQLLLGRSYEPEVARLVSEYVTGSKEQNQLFFEDYEAIFRRSAFEILVFKGHDSDLGRRYNLEITPELLDQLGARYPGKRNFLYEGVTALMRKS